MKIVRENKPNAKFLDLSPGDVFESQGRILMKISGPIGFQAVDLDSGLVKNI